MVGIAGSFVGDGRKSVTRRMITAPLMFAAIKRSMISVGIGRIMIEIIKITPEARPMSAHRFLGFSVVVGMNVPPLVRVESDLEPRRGTVRRDQKRGGACTRRAPRGRTSGNRP